MLVLSTYSSRHGVQMPKCIQNGGAAPCSSSKAHSHAHDPGHRQRSLGVRWWQRRTGAETIDEWRSGTFDSTLFARCGGESKLLKIESNIFSSRTCELLCASRKGCHAVEYSQVAGTCKLFAQCLHRSPVMRQHPDSGRPYGPANAARVMHQWGPSVPRAPSTVRWETNLTVVMSSFDASLVWLGRLPVGTLDLVVYQKRDYGLNATQTLGGSRPHTRQYVLQARSPAAGGEGPVPISSSPIRIRISSQIPHPHPIRIPSYPHRISSPSHALSTPPSSADALPGRHHALRAGRGGAQNEPRELRPRERCRRKKVSCHRAFTRTFTRPHALPRSLT